MHDLAQQAALIWAQHNASGKSPDKFGASVRQVYDAVLGLTQTASEAPRSESCEEPQSPLQSALLLILSGHGLKQSAADVPGAGK